MHRRLGFSLAGTVFVVCWLHGPVVSAQSNVHTLIAAIQGGESVRTHLRELWIQDSSRTYEVAEEVQAAFENLGDQFGKAQTDSLLRIQAIGWAHDPGDPSRWLVQRALLAMGHVQDYPLQHRAWAMEAVRVAPMKVPRLLVERAGQGLATAARHRETALSETAADWAALDRVLLLRQLQSDPEAPDWAKLRFQLHLEMRSAFPDCEALTAQFASSVTLEKPSPPDCKAFLVLHDLQGCEGSSIWDAAWAGALQPATPEPWLHSIAGAQAFNRRAWSDAIQHWQTACHAEPLAILRAHGQLQIAAAYQAQSDYRPARSAIQEAMRLAPGWGEPYLALMDLYISGSEQCAFSEFDRKALNWLLMGLCKALRSVDGNYAEEADQRHYRYQQQCPTPGEAAFWGWKQGDTYPFKCWMSTAATVQ